MKFIIMVTAILALSSCQKSDSKNSIPTTPPNQQGNGNPPGNPPPPNPDTSLYPIASFDYYEFVYDGQSQIHLHVLLSEASSQTIAVDISLTDDTSAYPRDYSGFASGGDSRAQTVVFQPGERISHHFIIIPGSYTCGGKFFVNLSANGNAKVKISRPQAIVLLNCR